MFRADEVLMEEGVAVKAAAPPTAVRTIAAESFMVEVVVVERFVSTSR
jgi:hypothetical protein